MALSETPRILISSTTTTARGRTLSNRLPERKRLVDVYNHMKGLHVPNYLYKNTGNLRFENYADNWGIRKPSFSNGAAYADLDNDGDLDLIVNNLDEEAHLYKNNLPTENNRYLVVKLEGPASNPQALGAKVFVHAGNISQYRYQNPHRGYNSTVDPELHFGLGQAAEVDSLIVIWPGGASTVMYNLPTNQHLTLEQETAQPVSAEPTAQEVTKPLFEEVTQRLRLDYEHRENNHLDFDVQHLLLKMHSRQGPAIAVGDINGDLRDDFFIGGAAGLPASFFVQQPSGDFFESRFPAQQELEDTGALLFDADQDNDLDLYVVTGGSSAPINMGRYQDRLYLNDGNGNYELGIDNLPPMNMSGSCVSGADFDKDGDLDLFVGGRVMPGYFPLLPKSYLLSNKTGTFTIEETFEDLGMVTSALWTDFNNDDWLDLIIVGEWMAVTLYENNGGKLRKLESNGTGLEKSHGWWNSITAGDFDNDSDMDYILGNFGENTKYQVSVAEPIELYGGDLDNNGYVDPVMSQFLPDREGQRRKYPLHPRDALVGQLNSVRQSFGTYAEFGLAGFHEIFPEPSLTRVRKYEFNTASTVYLENQGEGRFQMRPLPYAAQLGVVQGTLAGDFDADGNLDVLLQGNDYATELSGGIQDALIGLLLCGNGDGTFRQVETRESGLMLTGDRRALAAISIGGRDPCSFVL